MRLLIAIWLLFIGVAGAFAAETPLAMNEAFRLSADRTAAGTIHLRWVMPPGYYLYRQHFSAKTADGTPVELTTAPGVKKNDANFGDSEVYYGSADADLGHPSAAVTVTYQGCQEHGLCYPPARRVIDPASLRITEEPLFIPPTAASQSAWSPPSTAGALDQTAVSVPDPASRALPASNIVQRFLDRGGIPLLLAAFFGFGILLAFTPCVFPLFPILAATLSREGEQLSTRRGLLLSVSYAVALATAFGLFGAIAGWTGENLQIALQSSLTVGIVAILFGVLGLSMFGLFELQLPSSLVTRLSRGRSGRGGSVASAAAIGFSSAFIIGPCVTAPLAGALLYVARTGDIALGAALLFALGLGKGVPLVIFGTVGARALPRAGAWMNSIKHIFGFVFFAFAIWMAEPIVPAWLPLVLWAALLMGVAVYLRSFHVSGTQQHPARIAAQALGLLAAVYAVILMVGAAAGSVQTLRPLDVFAGGGKAVAVASIGDQMTAVGSKAEFANQLDLAKTADKPLLVYFTADWCVSCRTIDRNVLSDPDVVNALSPVHKIKVDLSNISPSQRVLMKELDVVGPPTMIFFRRDQREAPDTRLIGEIGADDLLTAAKAVQTGS